MTNKSAITIVSMWVAITAIGLKDPGQADVLVLVGAMVTFFVALS